MQVTNATAIGVTDSGVSQAPPPDLGVLPYGGGVRVWMVLALLAMGLGCSEEPPEQWSHPMRQALVDGCVVGMDDPVTVEMLD